LALALSTRVGVSNAAPIPLGTIGDHLAGWTNWQVSVAAGIDGRSVGAASRQGTLEEVLETIAFDAAVVVSFDVVAKRISFSAN
jgi:hypothetical protein